MAWTLKHRLKYRLRLFELYGQVDGAAVKIGQCAVGVSRRGASQFLDRIQLLPEFGDWPEAMAALLAELGPGEFTYGWELNLEPPRHEALSALPGVTIKETTPLVVNAIDFSRWDSWESYFYGMRKGARQSAQFARRDIPDLRFKTWTGRSSMRAIPALLRLRWGLSRRKGLGLRVVDLLASYMGWMAVSPHYTVTRLAVGAGATLAAYYGADFGANTYYLEGASEPGNQGASWALLVSMIQRAYVRNPKGTFIMGYVNYATHDEEVSGGLLRARTACRVSDYPTSVIRFHYSG
ncbi:hypothetical protein [Phenylobacterium sp.]|uniref:hypothetical protein n=1 Tax=Phenylobacterium sp. TaxID=1871053 RepID=UPI00286D684A|nr:hypothetical protein [Phenylobacterium sp.]